IKLYFPREEDIADPCPSARSLGFPVFAKYAITLSATYCLIIFLVESMSFFRPIALLLRIASSTLLTFLLVIATDSLTSSHNEKRL
ncbi:MAG: rod shape-determining protein MreD, partial [Paramuribaculum sp.]|nr:rod shape-determining protein MreD [Paramuribaculum sp.]